MKYFIIYMAFLLGILFGLLVAPLRTAHSAGDKGGACYPNGTCNAGLECWVADGLQPTCVKP